MKTKYQVSLHVNKVELCVKFPCQLQVMWKKGQDKITTGIKEKLNKKFIINETLEMTVFQSEPKKTYLIALIHINGQSKLAGVATFIIDKEGEGKMCLSFEKSPDVDSKIYFTFKIQNLGQIEMGESRCSDSCKSEISHKLTFESFGEKENNPSFSQKKQREHQQIVNHMQMQIKNFTEQLEIQKNSTSKVENEHQIIKELYEKALKELDQMKQKYEQFNQENLKYKQEQQQSKDQLQKCQDQVNQYKNEIEYLENEVTTLKKERKQFKEQISELSNHQQVQHKLQKEIDNLKTQNLINEAKFQNLLKKKKELEEQVERQENKKEMATSTNLNEIPEQQEKDKQLKCLEQRFQDELRKSDKFQYENQMLKSKLANNETESNQYKQKILQMQQQLESQKVIIGKNEKDIQKLNEYINNQEQEFKQQSQNSSQIQNDIQLYKKQSSSLAEKYKQAKERILKMDQVIDQLNHELNVQSLQYLKELKILTRKQETLS